MRLNGTQRLLVVIAGTAIAVWLLWTPYRDALDQISHQLRNNGDGGDARAAGGMPRRYRRMECTGSIWSDKLQCSPWHGDPAPGDRRGGGQW